MSSRRSSGGSLAGDSRSAFSVLRDAASDAGSIEMRRMQLLSGGSSVRGGKKRLDFDADVGGSSVESRQNAAKRSKHGSKVSEDYFGASMEIPFTSPV